MPAFVSKAKKPRASEAKAGKNRVTYTISAFHCSSGNKHEWHTHDERAAIMLRDLLQRRPARQWYSDWVDVKVSAVSELVPV